jgi:Transglycosylase SLT domain
MRTISFCLMLSIAKAACLADFISKHNKNLTKDETAQIELSLIKASDPQTRDYTYKISVYTLVGLMLTESSGRYYIKNHENAEGLCQVIQKYNQASIAKMIMIYDSDDSRQIKTGAFLCGEALRERLHKAKGNINKALDYYHGHAHMSDKKIAMWRSKYNAKVFRYSEQAKSFCSHKS